MDVDFWASRVHPAKHLSAVQAARLNNSDNHFTMVEIEGNEDIRAWFPCPFCYVDIEVPVLCSHLQEEHCFDLKNVRKRESQKSGFWSNSSIALGKDLQEPNTFISSNSINDMGNVHETTPDPLLLPFLCNLHLSDPKNNQADTLPFSAASTTSDTSVKPSKPDEAEEQQDYEGKRQRATFVQQLIFSTIF